MSYIHVVGDATDPIGDGNKIIAHCCNDCGAFGKGFVVSLSKKYPETKKEYLKWFKAGSQNGNQFKLGNVQFVRVEMNIEVANIIGQHDIKYHRNVPPIRYSAIRSGFRIIANKAKDVNASIHMPRIGAGLAGGNWHMIEDLIREEFIDKDVSVNVYTLSSELHKW